MTDFTKPDMANMPLVIRSKIEIKNKNCGEIKQAFNLQRVHMGIFIKQRMHASIREQDKIVATLPQCFTYVLEQMNTANYLYNRFFQHIGKQSVNVEFTRSIDYLLGAFTYTDADGKIYTMDSLMHMQQSLADRGFSKLAEFENMIALIKRCSTLALQHFNPRRFRLAIMTTCPTQLEPGKIYIEKVATADAEPALQYTLLNPEGKKQVGCISMQQIPALKVLFQKDLSLKRAEPFLFEILKAASNNGHIQTVDLKLCDAVINYSTRLTDLIDNFASLLWNRYSNMLVETDADKAEHAQRQQNPSTFFATKIKQTNPKFQIETATTSLIETVLPYFEKSSCLPNPPIEQDKDNSTPQLVF